MRIHVGRVETPIGILRLSCCENGICGIEFPLGADSAAGPPTLTGEAQSVDHPDHQWIRAAQKQLTEYFQRRRREFDLPLALDGTEFQRAVWNAILSIPCGATTSYRELAVRIGRPQAVRAVGAAVGRNSLAIVVPCHRVIGSNGKLTGFAGGISVKELLLELECARIPFQ